MSTFNADELINALSNPKLIVNGVEYDAKPLSFRDFVVYQNKLQNIHTLSPEQAIKLVEDICHVIDVDSDIVLSLPTPVAIGALISFFNTNLNPPPEN